MTVLSIVSSPRKGGFGDQLASQAEEGARTAGKEVERCNLNEFRVFRQCQNCEGCKDTGVCVLKDDISPVMEKIRDAEGLIFVTSINFNDTNGMFKILLDRFYCFLDRNSTTIMPKGKKVAVIVTTGADPDSANRVATDLTNIMTQHFFCESVGKMVYNTWMMPKEIPIDESALDEARALGEKFGS